MLHKLSQCKNDLAKAFVNPWRIENDYTHRKPSGIYICMYLYVYIHHIYTHRKPSGDVSWTLRKLVYPFKLNGIWSGWQFSFWFLTKWNSIWLKNRILDQIKFHLIQNRKENCHLDHIPFNLKRKWNTSFLSGYTQIFSKSCYIKPNLECIYTLWFDFNKIQNRFLSVFTDVMFSVCFRMWWCFLFLLIEQK